MSDDKTPAVGGDDLMSPHELLEDLAEDIFLAVFENRIVTKIKIKIEKLDIIKKTESVGIEITKKRNG